MTHPEPLQQATQELAEKHELAPWDHLRPEIKAALYEALLAKPRDEWSEAMAQVNPETTGENPARGQIGTNAAGGPASGEPSTPTEPAYLITKGGAYYRPNAEGYTRNRDEAGRFTLAEAEAHSHPNGPDGPRDGIRYELAPPTPTEQPEPSEDYLRRACEEYGIDYGGFAKGWYSMPIEKAVHTVARLLQRLDAVEGEPVAWLYETAKGHRTVTCGEPSPWHVAAGWTEIPLVRAGQHMKAEPPALTGPTQWGILVGLRR